jgi:hypothetical protein
MYKSNKSLINFINLFLIIIFFANIFYFTCFELENIFFVDILNLSILSLILFNISLGINLVYIVPVTITNLNTIFSQLYMNIIKRILNGNIL